MVELISSLFTCRWRCLGPRNPDTGFVSTQPVKPPVCNSHKARHTSLQRHTGPFCLGLWGAGVQAGAPATLPSARSRDPGAFHPAARVQVGRERLGLRRWGGDKLVAGDVGVLDGERGPLNHTANGLQLIRVRLPSPPADFSKNQTSVSPDSIVLQPVCLNVPSGKDTQVRGVTPWIGLWEETPS